MNFQLHIVNWNSDKYSSISEAVVQPDGLAVLGMLFEISDRDNPVLDPLIDAIVKVRDPGEYLFFACIVFSVEIYMRGRPFQKLIVDLDVRN